MESIKQGRLVERFIKAEFPDYTHCTVVDSSEGISYTVILEDYYCNSRVIVAPWEAVLQIRIPFGDNKDFTLICCKVTVTDDNDINLCFVHLPTTKGAELVPIASKYIAR